MKSTLLTATVLMSLASSAAWAEAFYVELGRADSEADAKAHWETLQPKHKVLAGYDLYPNKILKADGNFTFRVQAGPMLDKAEADRVCRRLFKKDVSCFVIEGFDPNKHKTFDAPAPVVASGGWDFLPWQKPAVAPVIVQAPVEPAAVGDNSQSLPENKKAKVDVAEAIAVPVTEEVVTVGAPVEIRSFEDSAAAPVVANVPGWLSVEPFLDEARAQQFWADLKKQAPNESRVLSFRLIRPLVSHDIPKVILALGSFESENAAMRYCRDNIPSSQYLECRFSKEPPQGMAPQDAIATRNPDNDFALYWAQVLSEKSQDRALEKWEKIRTDNDDILADMRSQITTSIATPGTYTVRIGPLKSKSKAAKLCDTLKSRKVACSLVSL
jgi:hypothetical protein